VLRIALSPAMAPARSRLGKALSGLVLSALLLHPGEDWLGRVLPQATVLGLGSGSAEAAARTSAERSGRLAGRTVEVLVDGTAKKNTGELSGRTRCNRVVNFDGQGSASVGALAQVRISQVLPHSLRGTLASRPEEAACLSK